MDALMSHILRSAGNSQQPCDVPLNLSLTKYTTQTSDPLHNPEDLRRDVDAPLKTDFRFCTSFGSSDNGVDASTSDSSVDSSSVTDDSIDVNREVAYHHPFSIHALLGDADDSSEPERESAPAVVSSAYFDQELVTTSLVNYYAYLNNQFQQQRCVEDDSLCRVPVARGLDVTKSFWCHVCNALCVDKDDATRHQCYHRMHRHTCSLRKSYLYVHGYVSRHVKLDDEKIECGLCGKVVAHCFFTKHQRLHDGHICDVCNKEFSTNSRLQDHMNVHSGNTPFLCTICDRRFAKRSSLTQHQRYHRDHKSFKCSYCYKCFNSKYARAVHERLHTGDNPFKCPMPGCSRAFPQKIQLKLHLQSHRL